MNAAFWNKRFSSPDYIYGFEPNAFFKSVIDALPPGKLLLPGEGEGRNAVYAATRGWAVTAFDQSKVGKKKALTLAQEAGVKIQYDIDRIERYKCRKPIYDMVALIHLHVPSDQRRNWHRKIARCLKVGGLLILEGFRPEQLSLQRPSGGPSSHDLLYSLADLREDFDELELSYDRELSVQMNEGPHHQGPAEVVRLMGQRWY